MPISVIPINGHHQTLDYLELEKSFRLFVGPKCQEATLYVFNSFPAIVSSECYIDLLFIISINDVQGNYIRFFNTNGGYDYFRNTIVPIIINGSLLNVPISVIDDKIVVDDNEYENHEAIDTARFGLWNFLAGKCGLDTSRLNVAPMELIITDAVHQKSRNRLLASRFDPELFFSALKTSPDNYFNSYRPWTKGSGYALFKSDVIKINSEASKYSEYGYLTKRKIERIGKQLAKASAMYDAIGIQPTVIVGKAGTGKTSHLLHLLTRCLLSSRSVTFLTYNHLLTKDISLQVRLIQQGVSRISTPHMEFKPGLISPSVQTLMAYMYRLSHSLGVLHLMSEKRLNELTTILSSSLRFLKQELPGLINANSEKIFQHTVNWLLVIELIQNTRWDVTTKHYGILFIKFLKWKNVSLTNDLHLSVREFKSSKVVELERLTHKKIFLQDYPECLKNTLLALRNTEQFYTDFNVYSKYELLSPVMALKTRKPDPELLNEKISLNTFSTRVRNLIKGRNRTGRILMVDEAHDCHPFEREILYEIFSPKNVVISYGGKEQLIRFSQTCDWQVFRSRPVVTKKIASGNKSYRVKQNLLAFCNYIAERHGIDLKLEPFSVEDKGTLMFDFEQEHREKLNQRFSDLLKRGEINGCTAQDSLLIMDVNERTKTGEDKTTVHANNRETVINEYNVVEGKRKSIYDGFDYLQDLQQHSEYWLGAVADKQKAGFPAPNEVRVINYESCRGLEAWCTMCINIDLFYSSQVASPDAELYLLHEDLYLTSSQRAAMFAITWILMASTRAIDTLYLQMSNGNNDFVKLCKEYAAQYPENCLVLR